MVDLAKHEINDAAHVELTWLGDDSGSGTVKVYRRRGRL
jgi:hypothetical protein